MTLLEERLVAKPAKEQENDNTLQIADVAFHGWYRFVLSFPPHLVRRYLDTFDLGPDDVVLDPFCGTGTTLVECKKRGVPSIGVEPHPLACLASSVKTNWILDASILKSALDKILRRAKRATAAAGLDAESFIADMVRDQHQLPWGISEDQVKLLPEGFVSPKPLARLLILRDAICGCLDAQSPDVRDFFLLAFCHAVANGAGNFAFGPEIYRTKAKDDYDVLGHFALQARSMMDDLGSSLAIRRSSTLSRLVVGDARILDGVSDGSCRAVITSPPYPNEKDYTRITRVETVLLGLITNRKELRNLKQSLLRSNTRNVFVNDDDGSLIKGNANINRICEQIEARRKELGKTSGFEKLYHKVVAHYFGGMARHFDALRRKLVPGSKCAYVVGDQLSFLRVPIPTAVLLGEVAEEYGFRVVGCDLWRTRLGTKSGTRVREEVLILERI